MNQPRHPPSTADTKEKCSLLFGFARNQFLLKRKGHFSLVFCPQYFGQVAGLMRTRFCQNYFPGKGFGKTSADSFLNSEVASGGGGVWGGILRLLRCFLLANWGRDFWRRQTNCLNLLLSYTRHKPIAHLQLWFCHPAKTQFCDLCANHHPTLNFYQHILFLTDKDLCLV